MQKLSDSIKIVAELKMELAAKSSICTPWWNTDKWEDDATACKFHIWNDAIASIVPISNHGS